jgi:hypothetical protein
VCLSEELRTAVAEGETGGERLYVGHSTGLVRRERMLKKLGLVGLAGLEQV